MPAPPCSLQMFLRESMQQRVSPSPCVQACPHHPFWYDWLLSSHRFPQHRSTQYICFCLSWAPDFGEPEVRKALSNWEVGVAVWLKGRFLRTNEEIPVCSAYSSCSQVVSELRRYTTFCPRLRPVSSWGVHEHSLILCEHFLSWVLTGFIVLEECLPIVFKCGPSSSCTRRMVQLT